MTANAGEPREGDLRIGIVGAGMIATVFYGYLPGLRNAEGIKVAAITDARKESALRVAAEYDIPHVFESLGDMLASGTVDVVVNLTPAPAHSTTTAPILVVGTLYDPATPYWWAQALSPQALSRPEVTTHSTPSSPTHCGVMSLGKSRWG